MSGERCYRLLLRAYPQAFRAEYEREMLLLFRQARRDAAGRATSFWLALVWDIARSAPAQRLDALRVRGSTTTHIPEAEMKTLGIVTMVIGALEVLNSLIEGIGGGVHRPALQLLSVALGVGGGVALIAGGLALARSGARGRALVAAAVCLTAFIIIGLAAPVMSGAGMLLGIDFPLVLLVILFVRRGRDGALPRTA